MRLLLQCVFSPTAQIWHNRFTVNPIQAQWEYVEYVGASREDSCSHWSCSQTPSALRYWICIPAACEWHILQKKRESLNPVCKAKRCRHSAALGLTDERRWVDLESVDNTTAGLENINQSVQHNSEDSWQTGWADGAIFTGVMTHNGGIVAFGHFCLLIWTKVNKVWHFFWSHMWWNLEANSLNSCCTSVCSISAQNPYTFHIPAIFQLGIVQTKMNILSLFTHTKHKRRILITMQLFSYIGSDN